MHRAREWDAVTTVEVPGLSGEAAVVVALGGDLVVVEDGEPGARLGSLLGLVRVAPPYRAWLRRSEGDVWVVGARAIEVVELLPDPGGSEIEVAWDGSERTVRVDGAPRLVPLPELGRARGGKVGPYAASLRRLQGAQWEIVLALL